MTRHLGSMRIKEEDRYRSIKHTAELILAGLLSNPKLTDIYEDIAKDGESLEELAVDRAIKLQEILGEKLYRKNK